MRTFLIGVGVIAAATAALYFYGASAPVNRAPVEVELSHDLLAK